MTQFESNQSGIETGSFSSLSYMFLWFESNQSGIETLCAKQTDKTQAWFESNQSGIETTRHGELTGAR